MFPSSIPQQHVRVHKFYLDEINKQVQMQQCVDARHSVYIMLAQLVSSTKSREHVSNALKTSVNIIKLVIWSLIFTVYVLSLQS